MNILAMALFPLSACHNPFNKTSDLFTFNINLLCRDYCDSAEEEEGENWPELDEEQMEFPGRCAMSRAHRGMRNAQLKRARVSI